MRNEHRNSETIVVRSEAGQWDWRCSCGVTDGKAWVEKGGVIEAARAHGVKKHTRYGYEIEVVYL